jgi:hypothetical protein
MILGGTLACGLFCTRLMEITQSKISTTDKARHIRRLFSSDINAAETLRIGEGGPKQFSAVGATAAQRGNAITIYPTSDTNIFIRYYIDASERALVRTTNNALNPFTLARFVTNAVAFAAEDFSGNILTSPQNNATISMTLYFDQLEDPTLPIGKGQHYRAYQLSAKAAYRAL